MHLATNLGGIQIGAGGTDGRLEKSSFPLSRSSGGKVPSRAFRRRSSSMATGSVMRSNPHEENPCSDKH
jgi:hypothetical protein